MPKAKTTTSTKTATPAKTDPHLLRLHAAAKALDDKKAEDILILDLGETSTVARYFVIATATSDPHLMALKSEVEKVWEENFSTPDHRARLHTEAKPGSGWFVMDAQFMLIHLFTPSQRSRYNLEDLWGDAQLIKLKPSAK